MEPVVLESSSEEEDDVYLNSVAKLKALKNLAPMNPEKETSVEEVTEISFQQIETSPPVTRRQVRKWRARQNKSCWTKQKNAPPETPSQDSDLEIVSVEEKPRENTVLDDSIDLTVVEKSNAESSEDENYDIDIKILWRSKNVHRLNIRRNENFRKIYEYFANLEGVSLEEILITKKDKTVKKNDTPASINLSVIDILEGGVVQKGTVKLQETSEDQLDENTCMIKVQMTNKKSLIIPVKKDENFQSLFAQCAQDLSVEESRIKLYFDGEAVSMTDTPDSLEIEDEACFDLRLPS